MRTLAIALAAFAAVGIALPMTSPARAEEKVIIKKGDRDHDWYRHHHHHKKVVVIKHRDHDHDRY